MSNIPYLATQLSRRAGKEESFDIVRRLIKNDTLTKNDLAVLYSYFLPPVKKRASNLFEWLTLVCDPKASYAFSRYVLSENGRLYSANPKCAHMAYSDLELTPGWYDVKKSYLGVDVAIMPNIGAALSESSGSIFEGDCNSFKVVDTPTGLSYVLPWDNRGVNKGYFDAVVKALDTPSIEYSDTGPFRVDGVLKGVFCSAIIMPFELNGVNHG